MQFFRIFQHLLPRGEAWKLTIQKTLRRFFEGLSSEPERVRGFTDAVLLDLFPATARTPGALEEWEHQYGLEPNENEQARRSALAAEWRATGGQSPDYIEGVLRTAGFDVYVHDWWASGPPYVARDPRDYTEQPRVGSWRCGSLDNTAPVFGPTCSGFSSGPRCNRFLNNETHYLVNKDLTRRAPPPVPSDPATWPYFLYIGTQVFGGTATVDITRRAAFERLLLQLRPTHQWIVTMVEYVAVGSLATESGDTIITEDGDYIAAEG